MEDLQSLMSCLDEISTVIGDGMYLSMADKLKRIHNKLNGDKPFHEDSFYYSSDSDDDYETDSEQVTDNRSPEAARREVRIQLIRDHLLDYVRSMHQVWAEVQKWEKEVKKVIPLITRMTAVRKRRAIRRWCERSRGWRPGGTAGDLIGCGPIVTGSIFWSWKNLLENGLHAIVMEIGTEEEIEKAKRKNMHCDDLSLATLKKLPAFEKKIYDDYKREYNEEIVENRREANANVREHEESMQRWEMCAREEENKLRELGACVYDRDRWDAEAHNFWVDDVNGVLVNGP
uniref:Uncharacterized protein n=1 Tax=Micromonas commoda virus TaxID=3057169 RepID=A0AAU7YPR1_9PHYC